MFRFAKRMSVNSQLAILLLLLVVSASFAGYQLTNDIRITQAYKAGSAFADVAEAIGTWATGYRGLWIRTDPKSNNEIGVALDHHVVPGAASSEPVSSNYYLGNAALQTAYHWKNPALIQREVSDVLNKTNTPIKFKMVSDDPMNRENIAKRFEMSALELVRAKIASAGYKPGEITPDDMKKLLELARATDYYEVHSGRLLYARPIVATKGCLRCHESQATSPEAVRQAYPGNFGYNYKEGAVVGVYSVEVTMKQNVLDLFSQMSTRSWVAASVFAFLVVCVLAFVRYGVIRPVIRLTAYADAVKRQDDVERIEFDSDERTSSNQLHRLSASIKALFEAIRHYKNKSSGG